ncbi:MAG: class I SAM-dependent methyltransferase [Gemmatimonadota bacterium]|nr:class I SAM-dependent methyltransferase [Gemmatimonadota bacterium]
MIPWPIKIAAKIVLSRLPVPYSFWSRLNLFKLGLMADPEYAERVFLEHFAQFDRTRSPEGFTCLELGPGDSLLSAVVAHKHGSTRTYLIDVGTFAEQDVQAYRAAASRLLETGNGGGMPDDWASVEDMLKSCNATYLTRGLASLSGLPSESVDFIWSQAVLQHVRRADFLPLLEQTRRVLRKGGVASHLIDLRDHLGGKLNNLRFSEQVWEGKLFSRSGFYTNRYRYSEILRMCQDAGFSVRATRCDLWPEIPTQRSAMAAPFRRFDEDELRIHGFYLTLTR